ncbi:hypothetical protein [Clostridium neonatale]|uniref:Uncharacterized protein n=1 Tax=Clostridium neonatale TaxID=137838 RepID=A0AA86JEA2_9CLOT|nr:hypothetical protein [Clostridium neonatale]CAG9703161.1 Conserved hypothetical protein [Clostridium neonatale]CAI3590360.1 Conserved hypothetical protein [Clostridium neonatale]CAI3622377.1 Conserved hypothetical protein [Clostridium neonatale]CAI3697662.1 Conserved hypothetical protein [Clostridium neonatale]CAI3717719.1 Conserved hypothetical protein [Clostridium neonatale]
MNKKQLIVTSILICLMLLLSIVQGFFNKNFNKVALTNNGINEFKEYNFDKSNYIISLPNEWTVVERMGDNQYINNVLNFTDGNNKLTGSLQIINTNDEIETFAERDSKNQSLKYSKLEIMPYKYKSNIGVLSTYETTIRNGYDFKNQCYYLQFEKGKIVKILFNVKEKNYKENIKSVFNSIVSSVELS